MRKMVFVMAVLTAAAVGFNAHAEQLVCQTELKPEPCAAQYAPAVNPYLLLDVERELLAELFPAMSERELDLLWFKIADVNSQRSLD